MTRWRYGHCRTIVRYACPESFLRSASCGNRHSRGSSKRAQSALDATLGGEVSFAQRGRVGGLVAAVSKRAASRHIVPIRNFEPRQAERVHAAMASNDRGELKYNGRTLCSHASGG